MQAGLGAAASPPPSDVFSALRLHLPVSARARGCPPCLSVCPNLCACGSVCPPRRLISRLRICPRASLSQVPLTTSPSLSRRCLHFLLLCFQVQVRGLLTLTYSRPCLRYMSTPSPGSRPLPVPHPSWAQSPVHLFPGRGRRFRVRRRRTGQVQGAVLRSSGWRGPCQPRLVGDPRSLRAQLPQCAGLQAPCPQPARSWDLGLFSAIRLLISPLALPNKKVLFNRVNFEYREKASVVNYSVVSKAFVALRQTEGETQG